MSNLPRKYIKDRNGKFAGSVPSIKNVPGIAPQIPNKLSDVSAEYSYRDAELKSLNDRNLEVVKQMDNFLDALTDYVRSSEDAKAKEFAEYSARLEAASQKIDDALEMCNEILARNQRERERLESEKKGKFRKFFGL